MIYHCLMLIYFWDCFLFYIINFLGLSFLSFLIVMGMFNKIRINKTCNHNCYVIDNRTHVFQMQNYFDV